MQDYRKNRTYISANLSKHETESRNPYNKKLFKRLYRGYYVLNPGLAVLINDEWKNAYELMNMEEVKVPTKEEKEQWINEYYKLMRESGDVQYMEDDDFYDSDDDFDDPYDSDDDFDDPYDSDDDFDDPDDSDDDFDDPDDEDATDYDDGGGDEDSGDSQQTAEQTMNVPLEEPQKKKSPDTQFKLPFDEN